MNLFEMGMAGLPLDSVFVVDAHAHAGPRVVLDRDTTIERYLQQMDRVGIDVTCLMAFTPSAGIDLRRHNDVVYEFISACPDRFRGYCWVTPNYPEAMTAELERCFDQLGFSGIKIHLHSGRAYDDPLYAPMYEFANTRRVPILAHTWGADSIRALGAMAARYPNASFLCGHAGAQDTQVYVDEAKRASNFYLELCLSAGTPWIVEELVGAVGAERIAWGSDTLLLSSGQQIGKVLFADVPEQSKLEILGLNAARILSIADRIH